MNPPRKKYTSYLKIKELPLTDKDPVIWAYGKNKQFLGRLEISRAGLAAFTGTRGGKRIFNDSWRQFFERIQREMK